jgi:hypothetical protein
MTLGYGWDAERHEHVPTQGYSLTGASSVGGTAVELSVHKTARSAGIGQVEAGTRAIPRAFDRNLRLEVRMAFSDRISLLASEATAR